MTPEEQDLNNLKRVANSLNAMIQADPETMHHMFSPVWMCDPDLSETQAVCFYLDRNMSVNVLGIILGTIELKTQTYTLAADIVARKLLGFKVVKL